MHLFASLAPERALEGGKKAYFERDAQSRIAVPAAGR
jgi:hypothetical protein